MDAKTQRILSTICHTIEAAFPCVTAKFENFALAYLGGEIEGVRVIELFNVPESARERVLGLAYALSLSAYDKSGALIAFSAWDPETTKNRFKSEIRSACSDIAIACAEPRPSKHHRPSR